MFDVYVFNQKDANRLSAFGFLLNEISLDINGKKVWHYSATKSTRIPKRMPRGAVIKDGFHINFGGRRKGDG
jgi:hypothetical protein